MERLQLRAWVGVLCLACVASVGMANVISFSIATSGDNYVSSEISGTNFTAGAVAVDNWTDSAVASGDWMALKDNTGAWPGASAQIWYTTNYTSAHPAFANPGDTRMMSGHIYNEANTPTVVSFANIPYAKYDVYVYYNSGALSSNVQTISIDGTLFSAVASEMSMNPDSAFVLSDGTNDANYVKFSGVSLSDITIRLLSTSGYSYYNGVQIVEVPEPATMVLLGAGSVLALLRRRK